MALSQLLRDVSPATARCSVGSGTDFFETGVQGDALNMCSGGIVTCCQARAVVLAEKFAAQEKEAVHGEQQGR